MGQVNVFVAHAGPCPIVLPLLKPIPTSTHTYTQTQTQKPGFIWQPRLLWKGSHTCKTAPPADPSACLELGPDHCTLLPLVEHAWLAKNPCHGWRIHDLCKFFQALPPSLSLGEGHPVLLSSMAKSMLSKSLCPVVFKFFLVGQAVAFQLEPLTCCCSPFGTSTSRTWAESAGGLNMVQVGCWSGQSAWHLQAGLSTSFQG